MTADVVWKNKLDDRYSCTVFRVQSSDRTGMLVIVDTDTGETLLEEEVGLAYGAQWGPDVADVQAWQDRAVALIDTGA